MPRNPESSALILPALLALLLAAPAWPASPPMTDDFKSGPIDCDVLKDHPEKRYRQIFEGTMSTDSGRPQDLDQIQDLRETFWATYPNKEGHEEAREKFAAALFMKDLYILQIYIATGIGVQPPNAAQRGEDMPAKATEFLSGLIDGGIPQNAKYEFWQWAEATREALGLVHATEDNFRLGWTAGVGIMSAAFRKACNPQGKEYQAYVMERDWAEFLAEGKVPAGFDNRQNYGLFLYFRYGRLPYAQAAATYEGMKRVLTREVAESSAEWVKNQPKKPNGDLIVTLPEPVKRGPSGAMVDDYDAYYPDDITGVYRDQKVAFEAKATKDDPKRYLLYQLSTRFYTNKRLLPNTPDKWTYAANAYEALVKAFGGEQKILAVAETVRKAKKRVLTGSVIGEKEMGATRQIPLETIEDILCRTYPDGYLKASIAFNENYESPSKVDMEAEYRKLIADKGENAWLEAAKRAAAGKPSLLSKWELDGLKHELEQPTVAKAQGPMVDYPEYLAWKNFAVGAKVGRASRIWLQEAPGRDKLVARDLDNREVLQVKSIPADQINLWRTEQVFDSDGSAHPTRDMEIGYPAKIEQRPRPARPPAPGAQGPPFEDKEAESLPAAASLTNGRNIRWVDMTAVAQDSGDEVVQLCGRQVKTHRRSVTFNCLPKQLFIGGKLVVTVWTSDEIPGKLVRKTEDLFVPWRANMPGRRTVDETFIQEIAGFEPGTAVAGKASDEWTPPAVALGGPPQQPIAVSPSPVPLTRSPAQQPSSVTREPATPLARTPMDATSIQQHASLMRHYSPLIRRAVTARTQVRLIENRTPLPDDVKTAADAADVERQALLLAIQKHDSDAIEKNGKALEDHVTTMESFLQK